MSEAVNGCLACVGVCVSSALIILSASQVVGSESNNRAARGFSSLLVRLSDHSQVVFGSLHQW